MAKNLFILSAVFTGVFLTNCSYESEKLAANDTQEKIMKNFSIPDSIDTNMIAAMYAEREPSRRSLLVYNDSSRTHAQKITYFSDQPATIESIVPVRQNEFSSSTAEYVIKGNTVLTYYKGYNNSNCISFNWTSESNSCVVHEDILIDKRK